LGCGRLANKRLAPAAVVDAVSCTAVKELCTVLDPGTDTGTPPSESDSEPEP
jgi:hypothetical protein